MQPAVLVGDARRHGRPLDEDLAVLDPQVRRQQRPPGRAEPRSAPRRATASSPVRRPRSARRSGPRSPRGRSPPRARPPAPARRRRSTARSGSRSTPASSSRTSCVATSETTVTPSPSSDAATRSTSKPSWMHGGGPVDHAAHHDREPADVEERQAAEPAVGGFDAEVERRADRAPEVVAVGEPDRARARRSCRW